MNKALLLRLGGALLAALILTGCNGNGASSRQTVMLSGSTSVTEVMEFLAEIWQQSNPDISVEVQGTGSSAGIQAANNGTSEIGMSSRPVKAGELRDGMTQTILARDGIAIVVNSSNPVSRLRKADIAAIFKGEINNWQALGGNNKPIVVVTRDLASGTRGAFEDIIQLKIRDAQGNRLSAVSPGAQVASGNGVVKTIVAQNPHAIGYISLGSVDKSLKALAIDGVSPSSETIASGAYAIARPFVLLFDPQKLSAAGKRYLDWLRSAEASTLIARQGYIPAS